MKEKTISFKTANLIALLSSFILAPVIIAPYVFFIKDDSDTGSFAPHPVWFAVILVSAIIVHELIHGICFALFTKGGFKSVHFGIKWKALAPYCHCSEAVNVQQFRIAILMPTIILGFTPAIIAYIVSDFTVMLLGCCMILGGIGDFIALWMLRNFDKNTEVTDHPGKIGFIYKEINE
jgi:hypothetical protein